MTVTDGQRLPLLELLKEQKIMRIADFAEPRLYLF